MAEAVKSEVGSKERVALDLMREIAEHESKNKEGPYLKPDPRTYFLKLFNQCIRASVSNNEIRDITNNG